MKKIATVTTEGLNLRARADSRSQYIDQLSPGDQLVITDESADGKWLFGVVTKIASGKYAESRVGQTGWVHKSGVEVEIIGESSPSPPKHSFAWLFTWQAGAIALAIIFVGLMLSLR